MRAFLFGDRQLTAAEGEFGEALAMAHRTGQRPRCVCTQDGVPMYVARLGNGFLLKRMPGTGSLHDLRCPSQGLPIPAAPIAIKADQDRQTETTVLRFSFSLSRRGLQSKQQHRGIAPVSSLGARKGLTLAALLHYLWREAELDHWHPSFEGRRSWGTVRRRLLAAAEGKTVGTHRLRDLLYVPEIFSVEQSQEIRFRRGLAWRDCRRSRGGTSRLKVLIGELKELTPSAGGTKAVIKHMLAPK